MKKLVFVGIVFLVIGVLSDNVLGVVANQQVNKNVTNHQKKKQNTNRNVKEQVQKEEESKEADKEENFVEYVNLEDNERYILKLFVESVLDRDIRAMIGNINILSRNLSFRRSEQEKEGKLSVKEIINVLKQTSDCLEELLRVRSNLYVELFNIVEPKSQLSETADLDHVQKNLKFIDIAKFNEITAKAETNKVSQRIIRNMKSFAEQTVLAKKLLDQIQQQFSKGLISRIEGIPSLDNLSATDTISNKKLEKLRAQVNSEKLFDNDIDNSLWEEVEQELYLNSSN